MRGLILIAALFIFSSVLAQENINEKELIGFGCGAGGTSSDIVSGVAFDLEEGKYKKIIKKLNSKNPAERFMAVIVAERLSGYKYDLTETDKELIKKAYQSTDLVSVCSGCTYFDQVELKKLLSKDKENFIRENATYWLDIYVR